MVQPGDSVAIAPNPHKPTCTSNENILWLLLFTFRLSLRVIANALRSLHLKGPGLSS